MEGTKRSKDLAFSGVLFKIHDLKVVATKSQLETIIEPTFFPQKKTVALKDIPQHDSGK
jgi:hypothetical protein